MVQKIVEDVNRAFRSKAEADAIKLLWDGKDPPKQMKQFLSRGGEPVLPSFNDILILKRKMAEHVVSEKMAEALLLVADISPVQMRMSVEKSKESFSEFFEHQVRKKKFARQAAYEVVK